MFQCSKKASVFSYCPVLQHCIAPLSETLTSDLFKALYPNEQSPMIGQLQHTWASTTNNTTAVLNNFLNANPGRNDANVQNSDEVWYHKVVELKARLLMMCSGAVLSVGEKSSHWRGLWSFQLSRPFSCMRSERMEKSKEHGRSALRQWKQCGFMLSALFTD